VQKPDEYTRSIHALTSQGTIDATEEAEQVLQKMTTMFEHGIHKVRLDGSNYKAVIHAYASLGLPYNAEKMLFLMFKDWQSDNATALPNVRIFTSVLKAWQKAKTLDSPI
jgi:hypothetical protein